MTPRPRAISGTSASGKMSSLRLVPTTATESPSAGTQTRAVAPSAGVITTLPLRVWLSASSAGTTKPRPSLRRDQQLRFRGVGQDRRHVVLVVQVDHQPQRL